MELKIEEAGTNTLEEKEKEDTSLNKYLNLRVLISIKDSTFEGMITKISNSLKYAKVRTRYSLGENWAHPGFDAGTYWVRIDLISIIDILE